MSSNFLGILRKRFFRQLFVWFFHEFEWNSFRSSRLTSLRKVSAGYSSGSSRRGFFDGSRWEFLQKWERSFRWGFLEQILLWFFRLLQGILQQIHQWFLPEVPTGIPPGVTGGDSSRSFRRGIYNRFLAGMRSKVHFSDFLRSYRRGFLQVFPLGKFSWVPAENFT